MPNRAERALLYLAFGRGTFTFQARFSILSALAMSRQGDAEYQILVYSDAPDNWSDLPVTVRRVSRESVKRLLARGDYPYRLKAPLMLEVLQEGWEKVCFVDADTVFITSPAKLFDRIGPSQSLMHRLEGRMFHDDRWTGVSRAILPYLSSRLETPSWEMHAAKMWNAGVTGVQGTDAGRVRLAIDLIDELFTRTGWRLCEQAAFSILLQPDVQGSEDVVIHYWDQLRRIHRLIDRFNAAHQSAPLDRRLQACRTAIEGLASGTRDGP